MGYIWLLKCSASIVQFPIDLEQNDRREQLKKSGIGKVSNRLVRINS
jgi:hypothetical protein